MQSEQVNHQQRVALSNNAMKVIQNDCILFGCVNSDTVPAYNTFINRVFINYFSEARANISANIKKKREKIYNILGESKFPEISKLADTLINEEEKEMIEEVDKILHTKRPNSMVISIRNQVIDILDSGQSGDDSSWAKYYRKKLRFTDKNYKIYFSKFIIAVVEEYCRLSLSERRRIYYKDLIEQIERAIKNKHTIRIELADSVYKNNLNPLLIEYDKSEIHLYVAGLPANSNAKREFVSCRVDKIKKITELDSFELDKSVERRFYEHIEKTGIQYLMGKISKIGVRLTDAGKKKYQRLTFQRPEYTEIKDDIYIFNAPEYNIEVYFFKFGKDAEIVYPKTLRKKFAALYQQAVTVYNA